jgi:hypothetical protein
MSTNFTLDEQLQQYLDGTMPSTEIADFEKEIQDSKDLQNKLEFLKLAKYGVTHTAIRADVKRIHEQFTATTKQELVATKKTNKKWYAYIAAAAAVAILVFFVWNKMPAHKAETADTLYASSYKHYELGTTRGTTTAIATLYTDKKYAAVIAQYTVTSNATIEERFLAAMSYYELEQIDNCNQLLQGITDYNQKNNTILYKEDIEYYQGMGYLKQGKINEAVAVLNPIAANKKHAYSDRITETFIESLQKLKP